MTEALVVFLKEELAGINSRRQALRQQISLQEKEELVLSGAAQACEKMLAAIQSPELFSNMGTSNVVTITAEVEKEGQISGDLREAAK